MLVLPSYILSSSLVFAVVVSLVSSPLCAEDAINIGGARELFIDDYLIVDMNNVVFRVHQPERQEQFIHFQSPWESDGQGYFTIMFDGETYHMYYHAWGQHPPIPLSIAYMRSKDGIHWELPNLGLYEVQGSRDNNIVMWDFLDVKSHDLPPFVDQNPQAKPEEKFKAIGYFYRGSENVGLLNVAFASDDAVHWKPMSDKPVFSGWAFDTQNVAFWSEMENKYILYYRHFRENFRVIRRAISDDFLHWEDDGEITFPPGQGPTQEVQFYTNQIQPYYRNPHLYIGFPARYVDHGLTVSTRLLPEWDSRQKSIERQQRLGTTVTDSIFITRRDGRHFTQSNDVFVKPGLRTQHNWFYGDNYLAWGLIETDSLNDDSPRELSIWAVESYQTNGDSLDRRVSWKGNRNMESLAGKPIVLKFRVKEADI